MRLKRKGTRVVFAVACVLSTATLLHISFAPFSRRASAQSANTTDARAKRQATRQRFQESRASGTKLDLIDKRVRQVFFRDVTASVLPSASGPGVWRGAWPASRAFLEQSGGAVLLFDFDGDGRLDLLEAAGGRQRLYRNIGGRFTDVTARSGALAKDSDGVATAAIAGDYDKDGRADLFVLRYGATALYRNEGGGRFSEVTAAAKIPAYSGYAKSAAFVDCEHDGDLDLFVAGNENPTDLAEFHKQLKGVDPFHIFFFSKSSPSPHLLLRNNGDGTFADTTVASKLSDTRVVFAVVPTDYDNQRDVDLLVASAPGPPALWRNMRDGTFRNVSAEVGLGGNEIFWATSVAAGDVNKDGFTDFYFGRPSPGTFGLNGPAGDFALSDGRGHFQYVPGPVAQQRRILPGPTTEASQFIDYDADGLLDLVSLLYTGEGGWPHLELHVWRNMGNGWGDVSASTLRGIRAEIDVREIPPLTRERVLASGDLDGDGDTDIIFGTPGGGLKVVRNEGGRRKRSSR